MQLKPVLTYMLVNQSDLFFFARLVIRRKLHDDVRTELSVVYLKYHC
ncbi:hypothetical protein SAMN06265348_105261 [Pedobacter westerhofensis]|uniref:Uncharacterized protein n=1 Tax=Pedobacter westerhofensis TaxID=425512 RepID=A0A521DDA3_9SPHI|nr:hypothetical protein SAMN06265348_105261 [Pedobacter westerhofensis]